MAVVQLSTQRQNTPNNIAEETFFITSGVDTTATVTATDIKNIMNVQITPANAAAAAGDIYVTSPVQGSSVAVTFANNSNFYVTLRGKIA